jgi:hypothetical protein
MGCFFRCLVGYRPMQAHSFSMLVEANGQGVVDWMSQNQWNKLGSRGAKVRVERQSRCELARIDTTGSVCAKSLLGM